MDAPSPIIETEIPEYIEKNIINIELSFNKITYILNINRINEDKIKFILNRIDIKEVLYNYQNTYSLENLKSMNKYFKMFDTLNELENDLISIIKENNIEINNVSDNQILLQLKILARNDNIVTIILKKVEIDDKYKINFLFNKFEELKQNIEIKDEKINKLENKISDILKNLDEKDKRIEKLEKELNEFKNIFNQNKEKIQISIQPNEIKKINNNKFEDILINSNIFKNEDEIKLLLNNIQNAQNDIKLIYNSKTDSKNEEKLINTYIQKNDLIIFVKTDKSKRFGGYTHECFEKKIYKKRY